MEYGNLDKSDLPEFGYIKIFNRDKLSLPIEIRLIFNEKVSDIASRKDLLEKYRIRAPSEEDVENLLLNYKS